jgi:hypothetical protein
MNEKVVSSKVRLLPVAVLALGVLYAPKPAQAQLSTSGAQQVPPAIAPNQRIYEPVAPGNGNFIVFASQATNLVGDPNSFQPDISYIYSYAHDTRVTSVVSTSTTGAPSVGAPRSGGAFNPAVSDVAPDGVSYAVAFSSNARDIVPGSSTDNFFYYQVYVKIPALPEGSNTFLASKAFGQTGNIGASGNSDQPTVVIKGLNPLEFRLCFRTTASDLVSAGGVVPGAYKIVCRDFLSSGQPTGDWTTIEGATSGGTGSQGGFFNPRLSGDAKTLVFASSASIPGAPPATSFNEQVYSYSFATRQPSLISRTAAGQPADGRSLFPSISYQGTFISFTYFPLQGANHIVGYSGNRAAFMLHKISDASYTILNPNATDPNVTDFSFGAQLGFIDTSAKFCVFSDNGKGILGSADANLDGQTYQVYVKNLVSSAVSRVSVTAASQVGNGNSGLVRNSAPIALGGSGSANPAPYAAFISEAGNLASVGAPISGFEFLFRSPVTATAGSADRKFTRNIAIETPPDVRIIKQRKKGGDILLTFEHFTLDPNLFKRMLAALATTKARLTYAVEIRKEGTKQRINRVASRNSLTIRKLAPGSYTVRYRAVATKGKRVIRSQSSPLGRFVLS